MWPFKKKVKEFSMLSVAKESVALGIYIRMGYSKKEIISSLSDVLGKNMEKDLEHTLGISLRRPRREDRNQCSTPKEIVEDALNQDGPHDGIHLGMFFVHLSKSLRKKLFVNVSDDGYYRYRALFLYHEDEDGSLEFPDVRLMTNISHAFGRVMGRASRESNTELLELCNQSLLTYGTCPSCGGEEGYFHKMDEGEYRYQCHDWNCEFQEDVSPKIDWEKAYEAIRKGEETYGVKFLRTV